MIQCKWFSFLNLLGMHRRYTKEMPCPQGSWHKDMRWVRIWWNSLLSFRYPNISTYRYLRYPIIPCPITTFSPVLLRYTFQCVPLFTIKLLCSFTMDPIYLNFRFPVILKYVWRFLEISGKRQYAFDGSQKEVLSF